LISLSFVVYPWCPFVFCCLLCMAWKCMTCCPNFVLLWSVLLFSVGGQDEKRPSSIVWCRHLESREIWRLGNINGIHSVVWLVSIRNMTILYQSTSRHSIICVKLCAANSRQKKKVYSIIIYPY
jgi:hypothetical protein